MAVTVVDGKTVGVAVGVVDVGVVVGETVGVVNVGEPVGVAVDEVTVGVGVRTVTELFTNKFSTLAVVA